MVVRGGQHGPYPATRRALHPPNRPFLQEQPAGESHQKPAQIADRPFLDRDYVRGIG
jgi:hypothetical protein